MSTSLQYMPDYVSFAARNNAVLSRAGTDELPGLSEFCTIVLTAPLLLGCMHCCWGACTAHGAYAWFESMLPLGNDLPAYIFLFVKSPN